MRAIVTGGAGFIGSNLTDQLLADGHEVIVIDNLSNGNMWNLNEARINHKENYSFYKMDIRDNLNEVFSKKIDVVFHLAAMARVQPSIERPLEFDSVNTHGTLNLLEHCNKHGVKRFVFSSSSSVYGTPDNEVLEGKRGLSEFYDQTAPLSPYGLQKFLGEEYCRLYSRIHGVKTACLRYFNVYGERQSITGAYKLVMGIFAEQRLNGEPLTIIGDGLQKRDFTYVQDVVQGNIKAAEWLLEDVESDVFNIGHGDNRSVNQIAELFGGETINLPPRLEPKCTLADNTKARATLKWEPTISVDDWVPQWIESLKK